MVLEAITGVALVVALLAVLVCARTLGLGRAVGEIVPVLDGRLTVLDQRVQALESMVREELGRGRSEAGLNARSLRDEVARQFEHFAAALRASVADLREAQKERLDSGERATTALREEVQVAVRRLSEVVEGKLELLRADSSEKLERVRQTVEEKLQGTLEQRLGSSFKVVSDQLEQVFRSVGEMQSLATGVGDLKRVLTNVKTRGTWGEVALGGLLEQVMAPEQFGRNVEVLPGSGQRVEYAIRLPGSSDGDSGPVWLPIDAKFPTEDYERLADAAERGDAAGIEIATRAIESRVRASAREICEKYVHPPHSTDFAVLFLPTEGLFAEVIRRPGLVDALQRDCRIVVTGPTTLLALLNSLRIGFRTLAIQRRSSEVWQVLAAVKTEFGKFSAVMDKVAKKLHEAQNVVEEVGKRGRAVDRKLRAVEVLPEAAAAGLLEPEPMESGAGVDEQAIWD